MKTNEQFLTEIYQKHENSQYRTNISKTIKPVNRKMIHLCISIIVLLSAGIVIGVGSIIQKNRMHMNPTFTGSIDGNTVWIGSFQLAWNEFMDEVIKGPVEFETEPKTELLEQLNHKEFDKSMLSEKDYYTTYGITNNALRQKIQKEIKEKFHYESPLLNELNWKEEQRGYTFYSMINKKFNFLVPFDRLFAQGFGDEQEQLEKIQKEKNVSEQSAYDYLQKVKYFGINNASPEELNQNVEVLFYQSREEFAVKLKTKEQEEVYLYRTKEKKSFSELYQQMMNKQKSNKGNHTFKTMDELKVPYIKFQETVNYEELCHKEIKGMNGLYISQALQNVNFELNETGGNMVSEAGMRDMYLSASDEIRYFYFDDDFIVFLKEEGKELPYFALRIADSTYLEKAQEGDW